ncbi:ubiquinone biosynthesis protein UbiA [Candidatus Thioglobus autotrophicus]|uniref:Ubiquinone biosynthesis protein UbiA n=1 Tax=Candidatus Thioglobus autotrophicus TaxID=1705394 RepID=A0A0M5LKQ5_9GAMM|nr:prenyltransferase [Candidatus Thioglobus autotrophicus]ALE51798.1 ubiquinone biosynthesis protein UbiA [Candidatus Thioglobus autotrophicus]
MTIKTIIQSSRLPFLILTPICVLLGASVVIYEQKSIDLLLLTLVVIGGLSAHISVNTFNEYLDFKSGLDLETKRTNFSGGSGALPKNPEGLKSVWLTAVVSLLITLLDGIYFISLYGLLIAPIGLLGVVLIVTYTSWINKHPWLCLIAPGLGFGVLMVIGTQFVLVGEYYVLSLWISIIPFLLINNLLLLNQYPDIQADINAGRRHFPITYGVSASNKIYGLFVVLAMIVLIGYVLMGYLPILSLIVLAPILLAFFPLYGAVKYRENIGNHPQFLGVNVAVTLLTPLLLALSILI